MTEATEREAAQRAAEQEAVEQGTARRDAELESAQYDAAERGRDEARYVEDGDRAGTAEASGVGQSANGAGAGWTQTGTSPYGASLDDLERDDIARDDIARDDIARDDLADDDVERDDLLERDLERDEAQSGADATGSGDAAAGRAGDEPLPYQDPAMRPVDLGSADPRADGQQADGEWTARWQQVQVGFVDDPQAALQAADDLVCQALEDMQRRLAEERSGLAGRWGNGSEASTEDMRQALRQYRELLTRMTGA